MNHREAREVAAREAEVDPRSVAHGRKTASPQTRMAMRIARIYATADDNGNLGSIRSAMVELLSAGGYDDPNAKAEHCLIEAEFAVGIRKHG